MPIKDYSTTAANNTLTPPNGAPEGMAAGLVNNTIRQVMADTRSWYESGGWCDFNHVPTFVSTTSFTIPTDVTAFYTVGRRIRMYGPIMGTFYGFITASTYLAPDTTVTVVLDSGALTSNLSRVDLSFFEQLTALINTANILDDNVTNVKLQNMAGNTIKCNPTATTADPQDFAMPTQSFLYRGGGNIAALPILASQVVGASSAGTATTLGIGNGLTISGTVLQAQTRPAFYAYKSGTQAITPTVITKIAFSTELLDTNNCYDTTLSRFTPNDPGWYFVSASLTARDTGAAYSLTTYIYRNGVKWYEQWEAQADNNPSSAMLNQIVYCNGSTDYIEIYCQTSGGSTLIEAIGCNFMAWLTNIG